MIGCKCKILKNFGILTDNNSHNAKIQTPENIRAGKWIECPTCHAKRGVMPTHTYYKPCKTCEDWGILRRWG